LKTKIQNEKKTFIVEILERKKFDNKNYEINFSKTNLRRKKYDHSLETRKMEW